MQSGRQSELDLGNPFFVSFRFRLHPLRVGFEIVGEVAIQVEAASIVSAPSIRPEITEIDLESGYTFLQWYNWNGNSLDPRLNCSWITEWLGQFSFKLVQLNNLSVELSCALCDVITRSSTKAVLKISMGDPTTISTNPIKPKNPKKKRNKNGGYNLHQIPRTRTDHLLFIHCCY